MKARFLTLMLFLVVAFTACKKELIADDSNGRVYVERYDQGKIPIEGPFSLTFLKGNKVQVNIPTGGSTAVGEYKISGNFETKGSIIKVTIAGIDYKTQYVVVSKDEIATEGLLLKLQP
jgi:hypothetical protein